MPARAVCGRGGERAGAAAAVWACGPCGSHHHPSQSDYSGNCQYLGNSPNPPNPPKMRPTSTTHLWSIMDARVQYLSRWTCAHLYAQYLLHSRPPRPFPRTHMCLVHGQIGRYLVQWQRVHFMRVHAGHAAHCVGDCVGLESQRRLFFPQLL